MRSPAAPPFQFPKFLIGVVLVLLVLVVAVVVLSSFWYFEVVENDEIGIKIRAGQIHEIVRPGIASDFGLFVQLIHVKTSAVAISVTDEELITSDKQRLGLQVTADVFRPDDADIVRANYSDYRTLYINDTALQDRMQAFTLQAMKVCVGNRKFDDAVIGSGRDELRACIDEELSKLAEPLGLEVRNVAVPQITISAAVQTALDSIVQSRLATEKAKQDAEKAKQEATAQQALEEGRIRVEQSKLQEEARQQVTLQELKRQQLEAQLNVTEQEKINAQAELELARVQLQVATERALAELAREQALAELYAKYPAYAALQMALANASAIKATDKLIITPEGVFPNLIFTNNDLLPSVDIP